MPYGEERWTDGSSPTDFGFTSQRNEHGFGLYDYNARYYSSALGRFVSPDTIVPEPGNPQALNRYSYVLNRPLQGGDPTGHHGPVGEGVLQQPQLVDPVAVRQMTQALQQGVQSAGPYAPAIAGGAVVAATFGGGAYVGSNWAMQDMGPSYPLPDIATAAEGTNLSATWGLPETSTLQSDPSGFGGTIVENRLPKPGRRPPGGPPQPSKSIPKSEAGLTPSGPPEFDPNQKPPELDPKEEIKNLVEKLKDPNTPNKEKALILSGVIVRVIAAGAGLTKGHL